MIAGKLSTTNRFTMAPLSVVILMGLGFGLLSLHALDERDSQAGHMTQVVSVNAKKYADCLWYVARNHGFYMIQRDVALDQSDETSRMHWEAFVQSTGNAECGDQEVSSIALTNALALSVESADAHFLSSR